MKRILKKKMQVGVCYENYLHNKILSPEGPAVVIEK